MGREPSSLSERSFSFAFVFFLFALAAARFAGGQAATTEIKVDQVGYLPAAPKIALVSQARTNPGKFLVKRTSDNGVVLQGKLGAALHDPNTGDDVQAADFSALREPGRYYIEVPGVGRSCGTSIRRSKTPTSFSRVTPSTWCMWTANPRSPSPAAAI